MGERAWHPEQENDPQASAAEGAADPRRQLALRKRMQQRKMKRDGQALPEEIQSSMSKKLGTDLSHVRVHTDAEAAEHAESLGAQAVTEGADIYFGPGQYAPGTPDGDRLLAHELTHVAQEGQRGEAEPAEPAESDDGNCEGEADAVAGEVASGDEQRHAPSAAAGGGPHLKKKDEWADVGGDLLTGGGLPWIWEQITGSPMPIIGDVQKKLKKTAAGLLLGEERNLEGMGIAGADRQVEIGVENESALELIDQIGSKGPVWLAERMALLATGYYLEKTLRRLPPEERKRLRAQAEKKLGQKALDKSIEFLIGAAVKKVVTQEMSKLILGSEAFEAAKQLPLFRRMATSAGISIALFLQQIQGLLQRASHARKRCESAHPELYKMLHAEHLDMAYFLIEDHMTLLDVAVQANVFRVSMFGE